jgi:trigger factor
MEKMKVNVVDTKPCLVTLNVEVATAEVTSETEKVYNEIQKQARVAGFRAGKAPMGLIKKNYTEAARDRVIENLIRKNVFEALKQQGIEPVALPSVEEISFDFNKPLVFKVKAERHPEIKVKDYKGIKIKKEIHPVDDAKVKESIDALRERNARLEPATSDTVTDKSFLVVDYEGSVDGIAAEDLKTKNQMIDLSVPQTLAGFREGLVGAKKGDTRTIDVTFPADYPNKKYAGKKVQFNVTINEMKDKVLPELNDEFAKDLGLASATELQTKVKENLEAEETKRQDQEQQKQVIDHLLAANTFEVPASMVQEQLEYLLKRMADYFRSQRLPDAVWQKNMDQWREKYRKEAEDNVRTSYILNEIAKAEKIDVTEEDLAKEKEEMLKANAGREQDVEKYFNENKSSISSHMKEDKIFKFLLENAKIKEEVVK